MINKKDVITIRLPYPSLESDLATEAHMYICISDIISNFRLVKCQTLKPYMIKNPEFVNFIDEASDISRNPFRHKSRIDCDKVFKTVSVTYSDSLKAVRNVCDDLYNAVISKLGDNYKIINVDENKLLQINSAIHK